MKVDGPKKKRKPRKRADLVKSKTRSELIDLNEERLHRRPGTKLAEAPTPDEVNTSHGHRLDPIVLPMLEESGVMTWSAETLLDGFSGWLERLTADSTQKSRAGAIRGSSIDGCMRAQAFQYLDVEQYDPGDTRQSLIYSDGQFRHIRWQAMLEALTHVKHGPPEAVGAKIEEPVTGMVTRTGLEVVKKGGSIPGQAVPALGTMDAVLSLTNGPVTDLGVEIKGTRDITWVMDRPAKDHVRQIHAYMLLSGIRLFSIIYESKSTQEVREHVVEYNQEVADDVQDRVEQVAKSITKRVLPEIISPCEGSDTTTFFDCGYHTVCHSCESWADAAAIAP